MYRKCYKLFLAILITVSLASTTLSREFQPGFQEAGTYRWQDGCVQDGTVCGSIKIKYGFALLSLTAHGISVDIVLVDTGKLIVVAAAVGNTTKQPIYVLPEQFSLYDTELTPKKLKQFDSESLVRKKDKDDISDSNQILTAIDLVKSRISADPNLIPAKLPDTNQSQNLKADAQVIREMVLRADSLLPKKFVIGAVYFESDQKVNNLLLSVSVGGYVFEFPFVRNL